MSLQCAQLQVTETGAWHSVATALGYDAEYALYVHADLKLAYARLINPFLEYRKKVLALEGTPASSLPSLSPSSGNSSTSGTSDGTGDTAAFERAQAASRKLNLILGGTPLRTSEESVSAHSRMSSSFQGASGPVKPASTVLKPGDVSSSQKTYRLAPLLFARC